MLLPVSLGLAALVLIVAAVRFVCHRIVLSFLFAPPEHATASFPKAPPGIRFAAPAACRRVQARLRQTDSPRGGPPALALLCHGQGEILEDWIPAQEHLAGLGIDSVAFDYAGFGQSSPERHPANLAADTRAVLVALRRFYPAPPDIHLVGFSLGSAAALELASAEPNAFRTLILCESFSGLRALAVSLKMVPGVLAWVMPEPFDNRRLIGAATQGSARVHLLHSLSDEVVPFAHCQELHRLAGGRAEIHKLEGYAHNDIWRRPDSGYLDLVAGIIAPERPPR
jgi:pimeloyl-ACP methyl ester carboxylesterase